MDSSPDLSLKLRRGSSDSRDSFYMDFAQGIDSDIEEVDNTIISRPPPPPPILPQPEPEPPQPVLPPEPELIPEPVYIPEPELIPEPEYIPEPKYIPESEYILETELIPEPQFILPIPVLIIEPELILESELEEEEEDLELVSEPEIEFEPEPEPILPPKQLPPLDSPILPPSSPVSNDVTMGDYGESYITVTSGELPPVEVPPVDVVPIISPPPLPPNSLPLLPRLSLASTTSTSSQQLPPPPLTSQGTISDSTTSSPSPPPTPPPPPPLSIPPPAPDPLPPRHEPHSPTLSESSSSMLFHHHHHHTHNPHYQLPPHLQDYMQLQLDQEEDLKLEPEQLNLEKNHINSVAGRKPSIVSTGIATTPDTPPQHILSAGSSDGDTVSSVIATKLEPQQTTIQIFDVDGEIEADNVDEEDVDNNGIETDMSDDDDEDEEEEAEEELEGAEEMIAGDDEDDDGYDGNIEDDTINGISSHIIETHSDDIQTDTSSFIISMPHTGPILLEESTILEMPAHPPSPISPGNILVSSESVSHNSSPVKSSSRKHSGSQHRVTIDESNLPSSHHQFVNIGNGSPSAGSSHKQLITSTTINATTAAATSAIDDHDIESGIGGGGSGGDGGSGGGGGNGGNGSNIRTGHLALMYHSQHHHHYPMLPAIRKTTSRQSYSDSHYASSGHNYQEIKPGDALATTFSALYGKLLVVMGIAFPMAEVISTYIPPSFYEVYYLYLYIGSMLFLFFMYTTLLWGRPKIITTPTKKSKNQLSRSNSASDSMEESDTESGSSEDKRIKNPVPMRRPSLLAPLGGRNYHYGSFYLRMGAVAFGIGSMIYSGLEFGQYFELERDTKCHNVMLALTPATRMAFIFIQMYFIFLNNEQIKVYRHKIIARFGLMHMIGTNLSVWLNVLIQETKHEILTFYNPENRTLRISHRLGNKMQHFDHSSHIRATRGLKGPYQMFECRRTNIIGTLVQDASPFLFPCTIEYSLICAAILYVMWRSISHPSNPTTPQRTIETGHSPMKRSPHHYSVDCARAHKGLFIGILILVLTIISLILFFVLISRPEFVTLAVTEVTICELTIYATATIATVIGMIQIRHLQYDAARSFQLDDILLVGAQTGLFLYSTFTVIGGHFTMRKDTILVLITALASIVQTAFQTMFILDASRRQAVSPDDIRKKPGREIVTFMLVANLAMWAISTLEKSRAESHPIQLNFYGLWAWTIITHVSMPLAIFYRFHSTVCLCEIWKRAYKLKPTYM